MRNLWRNWRNWRREQRTKRRALLLAHESGMELEYAWHLLIDLYAEEQALRQMRAPISDEHERLIDEEGGTLR